MPRPIAIVTGAGRAETIGAAIVGRLAADGWDVAFTSWSPYDAAMPWGDHSADVAAIRSGAEAAGGRAAAFELDLGEEATAAALFESVEIEFGPVTALVLCHTVSVDSGILDTTVESFDRHFAVNVRANWLLIREFARRFTQDPGTGRIVALTSDHARFNVPYGASKGALDRIVIAAATELGPLGITANLINPGPIDTGWMTTELVTDLAAKTPAGRLGTPADTAALVSFLLSADGGWINGQLLKSDGGLSAEF